MMKFKIIGAACGAFVLLNAAAGPVSYLPWNDATCIDQDWLYLGDNPADMPDSMKDEAFSVVDLPHTWNAIDSLNTANYRRAASWYRRYIDVTTEDLQQRLYIRFGAAAQQSELYVNGVKQLSHKGGYTAFVLELTHLVEPGKNRIDIRVSNAHDTDLIPHSADFTFYGGLYRSVHLLRGPNTGICRTFHGGPSVRIWSPEVSAKKANLLSSVRLDHRGNRPASAHITLTLTTPDGTVCGTATSSVTVKPGKAQAFSLPAIKVTKPKLWSPESPALYKATITVSDSSGKVVDTSIIKHGFRWVEFTADRGFFLNGKPYILNGVNRHQDLSGHGNALTVQQHEADLRLIKETGANWLRLAHYTQHDRVLDLCDELGLLVWEEIPWVNGTAYTPAFLETMQSMMTEMIQQHFNHPSIIIWGISNEVWLKKGDDGKAKQCPMVEKQHKLIHELDPLRLSGIVSGNTSSYAQLGVMDIPDVIGYNLYFGWYGGSPEGFTKRVLQLHEFNPDKPLMITEYGAGSDMRLHSLAPKKQDFTEEWQLHFFEEHQKQAAQLPWLCGMTWWAFADFGSANRGDSIPHVNQKGLVTFDRTKKDLFYAAKARWSAAPVLHIQSAAWTHRSGNAEQSIRVISNMEVVELFHQGKSLGKQTKGFNWPLTFTPGAHNLLAKGESGKIKKEHAVAINWRKDEQRFKASATKSQTGNPIQHIADGKSFTRWSCEGNATVDIDLGHAVLLDGIAFSFYRGETRTYKMDILTSVDGKNFTPAFSGSSKGGKEKENISFPQVEARHIRILAKGSNESSWNSYYEVEPLVSTEKKNKNIYEKIGAGEREPGGGQ